MSLFKNVVSKVSPELKKVLVKSPESGKIIGTEVCTQTEIITQT